MEIYNFKKKFKRYEKGDANETENALIEAWYRSYAIEERQLGEDEALYLRKTILNKIKGTTCKPRVSYLFLFQMAASVAIISTVSL
jgi:transmembrane sensor